MFLLVIIYIAFISLGVPDSLIGSAWPAIYPEFNVPSEMVSYITMIISCCTVLSGLFSGKVLHRFGTAKVTAFSTAMTAAAMLGFSFAPNVLTMCILAIPLGFGAGAIDAGLNDYITLHYEAKHVNLLHCFYGIGVTCSPVLMSIALADNNQWRMGYRYAFIVQIAITVLLIVSLPLWKKPRAVIGGSESETFEPRALSFREMTKISELRIMWVLVFLINALECICSTWGGTFIAEAKQVSPDVAAQMISFFYIGLTIGRFSSGVISSKVFTWNRIYIGVASIVVALIVMCLPLPAIFTAVAFGIIGFGVGPIYPNLLFLTPHNFGQEVSGSIMGTQIAVAYSSYMLTPIIFGWLQKGAGMGFYPIFLVILFVLFVAFLCWEVKKLKGKGKYNSKV